MVTICSIFFMTFLPLWLSNVAMQPMNKSRSRYVMLTLTEYFVDQEKYFYLILLHINVAIYIASIAVIATGTMLIVYLKYSCEMFTIAR